MTTCAACSGAILEPGRSYQYSGPVCSCRVPKYQSLGQWSRGGINEVSTPTYIVDIINRLDRIENLLSWTVKNEKIKT